MFSTYARMDVMIIKMRMVKIHTIKVACTDNPPGVNVVDPSGFNVMPTARTIKVIKATPVTPYVSNPSAVGPTESPALSPVQSAVTPGLRASSSLILKDFWVNIFSNLSCFYD